MKCLVPTLLALMFVAVSSLSARTYTIDQNDPTATDAGDATQTLPFKTISMGALYAQPGDTVVVMPGIYRERVAPARSGTAIQPVTYLGLTLGSDTVYIRGSEVFKPVWTTEDSAKNIYRGKLDSALFGSYNPYHMVSAGAKTLTLGQIFVNGIYLSETIGSRLPGLKKSWYHDSLTDELVIHFPDGTSPATACVEISARSRVFAPHIRGLSYITVKGFVIEHGSNQYPGMFDAVAANAQAGLLGCRSGNHWLIENNVVRYAKSTGIDFGNEGGLDNEGTQKAPLGVGYHIIRNNIVCDNGVSGMAAMSSCGTQVIGNIIERNNIDQIDVVENAGFKVHRFTDGVFAENVVRNNYAYGVWVDSEWKNARICRNLFYGNKDNALFVELGFGPLLIDNNVFVNNTKAAVFGVDASNVTVVNNLMAKNGTFGLYLQKPDGRVMGQPANVFNWKVYNNIFYRNNGYELRAEPDSGKVYNLYQKFNTFTQNKPIQFSVVDTPRTVYFDTILVDTAKLTVSLLPRDTFFTLPCSSFDSLTLDFALLSYPTTLPLCGPFQKVDKGHYMKTLAIAGLIGGPVTSIEYGKNKEMAFPKRQVSKKLVFSLQRTETRTIGYAPKALLYRVDGRLVGDAQSTLNRSGLNPQQVGTSILLPLQRK